MKNIKTVLALGILAASLLVTPSYAVSENVIKSIRETDPVTVELQEFGKKLTIKLVTKDGKETVISDNFNQTPKVYNNRTLIGLRDMSENLGWNVDWDQPNKIATITKDGKVLEFPSQRNFMFVNGEKVELEIPSATKDDRLYLPLRFIGETFGYEVQYDHASRTATLVEPGAKVAKTKEQLIEYTEAEAEEARKYGYLGSLDDYKVVNELSMFEDPYTEGRKMTKYANEHLDENGWYNGDPLDIWKAGDSFSEIEYSEKFNNYTTYYPIFNYKIQNSKNHNLSAEKGTIYTEQISFSAFGCNNIKDFKRTPTSTRPYGKIEGDTSLITDRVVDNALEVNPAKYSLMFNEGPMVFENGKVFYSLSLNRLEATLFAVQDEDDKWYPVNDREVTPEVADEMAGKVLVKAMFKSVYSSDDANTYIIRMPAKKMNAVR